jgi:hypothetical protein
MMGGLDGSEGEEGGGREGRRRTEQEHARSVRGAVFLGCLGISSTWQTSNVNSLGFQCSSEERAVPKLRKERERENVAIFSCCRASFSCRPTEGIIMDKAASYRRNQTIMYERLMAPASPSSLSSSTEMKTISLALARLAPLVA